MADQRTEGRERPAELAVSIATAAGRGASGEPAEAHRLLGPIPEDRAPLDPHLPRADAGSMRTRTIIGVGAVLLLAALCGDTVAQPSHPAQTTPSKASAQTLTGVVRIAEPSPKGGKRFLGVLLEVDTGPACVLTYRADDLWAAFNGRRIVVTGQRYYPEGQALLAPHFKPLNWHVERPATEDAIIDVGPEMTLRGTFAPYTWPAGTKLAGETVTRFVAAPGEAYFLAKAPTPLPLAKPVEVRARRVEPSRFIARPGGSYLWIYEIMPR